MSQVFNADKVDPNLPGIIIVSHGPLAVAAVETLRMLSGEEVNIAAFSLEEGERPEDYKEKVGTAIEAFPEGSIIFADIMGGTPSNTIMMYARENNKVLNALAGFNIPMLMQAALEREMKSGKELLESVLSIDDSGVFNIMSFLENSLQPLVVS